MVAFLGSPKQVAPNGALLNNNIRDSTLAEKLNPPYRNYQLRIDQNVSDKDKLFGRYSWYNRNSSYNNYTGNLYVGDRFLFVSKQGMVDDVHTFNGNTILNVRYGFNASFVVRMRLKVNMARPDDWFSLHITRRLAKASGAFRASISAAMGAARCDGWQWPHNEFRPVSSHFATAVVNRAQRIPRSDLAARCASIAKTVSFRSNNQSGQFSFDNTYTRLNSSGAGTNDVEGLQAFAAFLLGYPSDADRASFQITSSTQDVGLFAQDDLRLQELTLNSTPRWEFEQALTERQNKSVSTDLS